MTVHHSGTLTLTSEDFKIVHRGVELGVKCIAWDPTAPVISIVERMPNNTYQSTYLVFEFSDSPNTTKEITTAAGGTTAWIKSDLVPRINFALAQRFLPDDSAYEPGSIEDIDSQLGLVLKWVPQADGTLIVQAK